MAERNLKDFQREFNPMFEGDSPVPTFDWKLAKGANRVIVVAAQNATPVHADWWAVLMNVCGTLNAQPVVLPIRYKNPTSTWQGSQKNAEHWAGEVRPFLGNVRAKLNANLMLLGDIKIQPTAADPLTGFEAVSGASSAIVGHPKIQTRSIATPQNKMPKLLMTSGMCTVSNYSDTRAGRVGHFHHSLSAVLVELEKDGKTFYMRRLHFDARTKSTTDAATGVRYYRDRAIAAPRALALVVGDLHERFADPKVVRCTFGSGGMIETARPRHVIYHDTTDGYSVNHHHGKNPFYRIAKRFSGMDSARAEIEHTLDFLRDHKAPEGGESDIITSNHDDFFSQYIVNQDWREDPTNAEWYLETALMMVRGTKLGKGGTEHPNPFVYWMRKAAIPGVRVIEQDESFTLAGVECGMHGNRGPNGARGSIRNIRRIGVKTIIGHAHSPGEDEGCVQVGTSTGKLEYVKGPSSWLQANCFLNDDGKRQLSVIVNGRNHL